MKAGQLHPIGKTALGNIYAAVEEQAALDTVDAEDQAGVRYFDTAPLYGSGLSEIRLGKCVARFARDKIVISSKVGWTLEPNKPGKEPAVNLFENALPYRGVINYSADAIKRSLEDSLKRLNTERIDIVLMHDPDEAARIQGRDPYVASHFDQARAEA